MCTNSKDLFVFEQKKRWLRKLLLLKNTNLQERKGNRDIARTVDINFDVIGSMLIQLLVMFRLHQLV